MKNWDENIMFPGNNANIDEVVSRLKDKGYRITAQRQALVEKLVNSGRAMAANDVWEMLRAEFPEVSLDTVYRNLHVLVDLGVLTPINALGKDSVKYELVHDSHHHHIVCIRCGQSQCVDFCPIDPQFITLLKSHGFELLRHNLELFGVCGKCKTGGELTRSIAND